MQSRRFTAKGLQSQASSKTRNASDQDELLTSVEEALSKIILLASIEASVVIALDRY